MEKALRKILYAEDDQDVRKIAAMAIQRLGGFELELCADGHEAIRAAPRVGADLIVLDVMMPGLDGLATVRRLRTMPETAQTPVVFMTARIQPSEVEFYRKLGVINVIGKPFDPVALPGILREIWSNYCADRERGPETEEDGANPGS